MPSYTGLLAVTMSLSVLCQWCCCCRESSIEVISTYLYPDTEDLLERPPYAVLMRCSLQECGGLCAKLLIMFPLRLLTISCTSPPHIYIFFSAENKDSAQLVWLFYIACIESVFY